jgi:hypothetical protein
MKYLLIKQCYFSDRIIRQWVEVVNIDIRMCSNTNFIWPQNVPVNRSNFKKNLEGLQRLNPQLNGLVIHSLHFCSWILESFVGALINSSTAQSID